MNQYSIGCVIKNQREKLSMTQLELSEKLFVSDKTISKWETGRGYPDITFLEKIASVLSISVSELIKGYTVTNQNKASDMAKALFYVCPVCANIVYSAGEALISCHGVTLSPLKAEECDDTHFIKTEEVEDEIFVSCSHPMTKEHYISFIAAVCQDRIELVKLYPEGEAQCRFKKAGVKQIYLYCNKDGLYNIGVAKSHPSKSAT